MSNTGSPPPDDRDRAKSDGTGTNQPPQAPRKPSSNYPTGSLSKLVPGQKASTGGTKPNIGSAPPNAGPEELANAPGWQEELQAGALARAQERKERTTANNNRPSSVFTNECEKIVQTNIKTTASLNKPAAAGPIIPSAKKRAFAAWRTFGFSMVALSLLLVCIYATKQASVQTEAKRAYIVGRNFLRDGKYDLAIENFTRSLRRIPYNSEGYYYRAMAYAHTLQFEQALQDFDKVLTFTPDRVGAYNGKSLSNLKLREFDRAITAATQAIQLSPTDKNALLLRSIAYARKGNMKEALADCNTLIESKPKTGLGQAYANRAFIFFKMGQVIAAIRDYRYAIKNSPENAALYSNLAQCLKRTHDIPGAIAESKACLKWDPRDLPSLMLLGECYKQSGDHKLALEYIERAVAVVASYETLSARADAYIDNGNYKLAYNDLDYILRCRPNDENARRKRQVCHNSVLKAEGAAAAKDLEVQQRLSEAAPAPRVIKLATNVPELLRQGYSLLQAGSSAAAVEALMQAVRIDPAHIMARRYLAYALEQDNDHGTAVQQFAQLSKLQKLNKHDLLVYGQALAGSDQNLAAVTTFKQLLALDPRSFAGRSGLIKVFIELGQGQSAIDAATEGMKLASSESERTTYRSLLTTAQKSIGRND